MRICVLMALLWTAMAMESAETKLTDGHWAYQKPVRPALPRTDSDWPRNAIDFFVLHRLETNNLRPSPAASPEQLLRRVHLDLIGLPPSPAVVDAFLANPTDAAYETIVDDLLKSKRYGERWARPWLDLARYADSNGFQADQLRDSWAYRDWVINAFNSGMPFNQFVTEQIAGDMLPSATSAQRVATGFHRTPTCNVEAGVHPEENRVNQVIDRVNTTGTVFLGTTLECAQCHNHKYDPFSIEDYYSIFAFFNNTPLEVKQQGNGVTWNFYGPTMNLPISTEQQTKLKDLNTRKEAAVKRVSELKKAAKTEQLAWEKQTLRALKESPQWTVLAIEKFDATGNPEHELQKDGSILVTGKNPDKSTYTFHAKADLKRITAIRLEALTHPSMNKGGPGRNKAPVENPNFIVNEFQVETGSKMVKFASVKASFSQNHWAVAGSIDNDLKTGWAITPAFGKPAWAIYRLAEPLELKSEAKLKFTIIQNYGGGRTIGRPRLSAIDGNPNALDLPTDIAVILKKTKRTKKDDDTLAKHFLKESPKLKAEEQTITAIDKQIGAIKPASTLVMVEQDRARETHVMLRGQYLSPGDKINPGTPSILHPMKKTLPRNRLGFSKWLTDPTNPLIGRVTVNRWWAEFMGHGIVTTEEDFGTQAEPPTHPQLLDWLAVEFVERDWSMKHIHKLIVMSATYRQSSRVSPQLLAKDATNKFYARAPRLRMSAEMVRDNALAISGLLSTKMHGPPIYPPQPSGIWRHVGRNAPKYIAATNEDRFRRGVYVVWRRGAPYVSFMNFDAPDRGACVVRRPRTNTPLQALTLLNDEAYIEMAIAFAGRILNEAKGTPEAKIDYAYKTALGRAPRAAEAIYLKKLLLKRRTHFEKNPKEAALLISGAKGWKPPEGMDKGDLAAWFFIANILLNLDETITKS
jgi:hypothetical protein